jgi:ferredoxin-NADP reductase
MFGRKRMDYEATLISKENVAGDVAIFRFSKPEGYQFKAGQWCTMSVPPGGFQDERGLRRPFSIASAPTEKELLFATKLSQSAMKLTMAKMPAGTRVTLGQPMGTMVLPDDSATPLVFLAGGIGITPFRSMCCYAADKKTDHGITLFYSGRTPEETPFLAELSRIPERHGRVSMAITMTRAPEDPKAWNGLRGRLNADTIKSHCPVWEKATYYIAGPPAMADTMKEILTALAIPPDRIKIELFVGA